MTTTADRRSDADEVLAAPQGTKHDTGKARWDLVPYDALRVFVEVLTIGAAKYDDRNWEKGIRFGRLFAATQRHLTAWWQGENDDPETGKSHLAHAVCDVVFLLAFVRRGRTDLDDRPRLGRGESPALPREVASFIRDLATNHDHREDAHKHGTSCHVCDAEKLHKAFGGGE